MKLVAAIFLVFGVLSSSTMLLADGPVPFNALMKPAGAQADLMKDGQDKSATVPTQPPQGPHTRGGKTMIGVGIGLVVIGGGVIGVTAALNSWASPPRRGALYGGGGAALAGGVTLIIIGSHRHSTK